MSQRIDLTPFEKLSALAEDADALVSRGGPFASAIRRTLVELRYHVIDVEDDWNMGSMPFFVVDVKQGRLVATFRERETAEKYIRELTS